jgi:hypothetical protein
MRNTNKLLLALLSAALLFGATTTFASESPPQENQAKCRFIFDSEGNVIGYCCGNDCLLA